MTYSNEVLHTPVALCEDGESVKDDDDQEEHQCKVCSVWLPLGLEDEGVAIDALSREGFAEGDVSDQDIEPGDHRSDRGKCLEPSEDIRCTGRHSHVCEETNGRRDEDTVNRYTLLCASQEELWCLSVLCESEEVSRASV